MASDLNLCRTLICTPFTENANEGLSRTIKAPLLFAVDAADAVYATATIVITHTHTPQIEQQTILCVLARPKNRSPFLHKKSSAVARDSLLILEHKTK